MSSAIQRRRGTTAQHSTFTGLLGEITIDTDKKTVVVHDGVTAGGFPLGNTISSTATDLATTGASVNVSGSAPPAIGDILVATSATVAAWTAPTVSGDYSSNTTTTVVNEVLVSNDTAGKTGKRSKVLITPVATGATIALTDGKNLTLADALTTVGAYSLTLTQTAATNVTLPTTGTLATLAGAEVLSGKVMTGEASTGVAKGSVGTGTVTFTVSAGNYQSLTVSGTLTIAFAGWAASGTDSWIKLQMVNWGSATVTTPTINWQLPAGGFTTTFATYLTAIGRAALQTSGTDWGVFWTVDGGTTVYGKLL